MWFHTNFFIAPKNYLFNGEEGQVKDGSFTCSGEKKD